MATINKPLGYIPVTRHRDHGHRMFMCRNKRWRFAVACYTKIMVYSRLGDLRRQMRKQCIDSYGWIAVHPGDLIDRCGSVHRPDGEVITIDSVLV